MTGSEPNAALIPARGHAAAALITLAGQFESDTPEGGVTRRQIARIVADYGQDR